MKRRHMQNGKKMIGRISAIALVGACSVFGGMKASALTYQSEVTTEFTFNPTLSINLSSSNIIINNLAPGSAADSNIVTVGVTTNTAYGYVLSATAGIKGGNTNLTNTSDSTYKFTNLATTAGAASSLNNIPNDKWGYSYSSDSGSTWVSGSTGSTAAGYAGLPLDNNDNANERGKGGTTLISTDNPADSKSIQFKIGAKASTSQPAGTYTNVINFYAVTNPEPPEGPVIGDLGFMQDFIMLSDEEFASVISSMELETPYSLQDLRDGVDYSIALLKDGNVWMLKNLVLGSTESPLVLDEDFGVGTGEASDISSEFILEEGVFGYSDTSTFLCDNGRCYYDWYTATAGSGNSNMSSGQAPNSICPAGWRLPSSEDFYLLYGQYNSPSLMLTENPTSDLFNLSDSTPGFVLTGYYLMDNPLNLNYVGQYWASDVWSEGAAHYLMVSEDLIDTYGGDQPQENIGKSVRCMLRQ